MPAKDKQSQKEAARRHYEKNKTYYIDKARRGKEKQRNFLREIIRTAKDVPCFDCGLIFPYYVMQFDHTGDDKNFDVANAVGAGLSGRAVLAEIKKCDVVCSNCHAIRTHKRRVESAELQEDKKDIMQLMMKLFD